MHVSQDTVTPVSVEPMGGLLEALRGATVELRVLERLTPLRGAWATSLHASGIRLRNAVGWDGTGSGDASSGYAASGARQVT